MRLSVSSLLCTFLVLTLSQSALAAELAYQWKAGSTVRFDTRSVDHIDISAMGMSVKTKLTNTSTFALQVNRVRADGTAEGSLIVERFKVVDDKGRVVGALSDLPKGALRNLVEIDRKGNFTFKEIIYMIVTEKGDNLLVSAKVGPNGASGSAQAGGEKMTLHASFDPKTGQLSAGYSIEKVKQPATKKKKVAVKQDAQKVDILPTKFLEMLKLPEGNVAAGHRFSLDVANMKITTTTPSVSAQSATLNTSITTGKGGAAAGNSMGKMKMDMGGGGGMGMDMSAMGMGEMGGMGDLSGMGAMGGAPEMAINGDFQAVFLVAKGMLKSMKGNLTSQVKMSGVSMTTRTDMTLTAR